MRLVIVGTSHIAKQSVKEIKDAIELHKPDCIAIELDSQSVHSLFEKERKMDLSMIKVVGIKGFLFAVIGSFVQKKLGKFVDMEPGADMKTAVEIARDQHIKLALIDQPIHITLQRISKAFTWKEKMRFVGDIIRAVFTPKKELKRRGLEQFDLTGVPSKKIITSLVKELKERYPSLYKVLIEERNVYMVEKLKELAKTEVQTVVCVIGAGHEEGMLELLKAQSKQ